LKLLLIKLLLIDTFRYIEYLYYLNIQHEHSMIANYCIILFRWDRHLCFFLKYHVRY